MVHSKASDSTTFDLDLEVLRVDLHEGREIAASRLKILNGEGWRKRVFPRWEWREELGRGRW